MSEESFMDRHIYLVTGLVIVFAIVASVGAAYLMSGGKPFVGIKRFEVENVYVERAVGGLNVTIVVKNTGTLPIVLDKVFVEKMIGNDVVAIEKFSVAGVEIGPGEYKTVSLLVKNSCFMEPGPLIVIVYDDSGKSVMFKLYLS